MSPGQITTPANPAVASHEGNRSGSERFESCFAGFGVKLLATANYREHVAPNDDATFR
jgi:hypothetical protein